MRPCSSSTRCCTERSVMCGAINVLLLTTALRDLALPLTRRHSDQRCSLYSMLGTRRSQVSRPSLRGVQHRQFGYNWAILLAIYNARYPYQEGVRLATQQL